MHINQHNGNGTHMKDIFYKDCLPSRRPQPQLGPTPRPKVNHTLQTSQGIRGHLERLLGGRAYLPSTLSHNWVISHNSSKGSPTHY